MSRAGAIAAVVGLLALPGTGQADRVAAPAGTASSAPMERHHYSMSVRIRPLLVFWVSRSGVGDAIVTRRRSAGEASYSLLIGSDPDRAPRRINRWGYIEEEIRGAEAHLIGLMTQSDEDSLAQAERNLSLQERGSRPFKIIQGTVEGDRASSIVSTIAASDEYTFRELRTVLPLALSKSSGGKSRMIHLPPGTRPGFLAALADAMHASTGPITYAYYGRLYELRRTRAVSIPDLRIGQVSYGRATRADFVVTSKYDGEQTRFSMAYGTEGRFSEVPLTVTYQPRWWMQVELTIDDAGDDPALTDGVVR